MFRNLYPHEIEVRVQQCKKNGCSLLLYKDARCDMAILDETVGALNWKREHSRDNKNCTVSLWNEKLNQWVSKEDTGTESNTEQAKGLASDSFKRACFNWGIGRELYSSPFVWVNLKQEQISEYNGKIRLAFGVKFRVKEIVVDHSKQIVYLEIIDNLNNISFVHGKYPSTKWFINDILQDSRFNKESRQKYINKLKSKEIEANDELLEELKGMI